ncbi:MAG: transglycosylase domain-containing protein [Vicinamibacterales bacterium]
MGARSRRLLSVPGARRVWDGVALALLGLLIAGAVISTWWASHYALAVHRLTRGVGDTVFLSRDGEDWFRLDEQRHDVALAQIAPHLQHAIVAIEDRRFYYHPGIDPVALGRAIYRATTRSGRIEGGSTLTQQLARTLFLSNVRTVGRKAKEALIAVMIELELSKAQVLELYLNRVYLSAGVYGVDSMATHLFRKPASELTLAESALIAGLVRAPSALSPWSNYEGALARSRLVLAQMRDQGFISEADERAARRERPRIQSYRQSREGASGWAKDYLRQRFRDQFGPDHPPDWRVQTTFDRAVQQAGERSVDAGLRGIGRSNLQAALVAIDPRTGDLLAMVGGASYARSTFNRATRARRQPGSAFKPFVYAAALMDGYSPVTLIPELGASVPDDPEWTPQRASLRSREGLTLRDALMQSDNAAAVALQQRIGARDVLDLAEAAGLRGLPDVPSLALGTGLVSLLDLTAAYTIFPGGGVLVTPRGLTAVLDADGASVFAPEVRRRRVLPEPVAFQTLSILRDVVDRGTARPARVLGVRGAVGGKTGTTDDYHDAWFIGFSSEIVAGVWVGFDAPAPIGRDAYAARVALPIWAEFMKRTARVLPPAPFPVPSGVETLELCSVSHLKAMRDCPTYVEYFKEGDDIPSALCSIHKGTVRQRASRAVEGFFRGLGARLKGLFGR